jgi:hypothetical protein
MCLGVEFSQTMTLLSGTKLNNGEFRFMNQSELDAGTIAALMLRMTEYRLPRAKRMLARVDEGEKLRKGDIRFLKRVFNDSKNNQQLIKRNPEYLGIVSRFLSLYTEITTKALENEKAG